MGESRLRTLWRDGQGCWHSMELLDGKELERAGGRESAGWQLDEAAKRESCGQGCWTGDIRLTSRWSCWTGESSTGERAGWRLLLEGESWTELLDAVSIELLEGRELAGWTWECRSRTCWTGEKRKKSDGKMEVCVAWLMKRYQETHDTRRRRVMMIINFKKYLLIITNRISFKLTFFQY